MGAMSSIILFIDSDTSMEKLRTIATGDDVIVQAEEETTHAQPYGTGRKVVRDIGVLRGNERLAGFGGLGQRPDPRTERGIVTDNGSIPGGILGQVSDGTVTSGITSEIGTMTGAAPCWQCEPQPGWGYGNTTKTDYGSADKPSLEKGGARP